MTAAAFPEDLGGGRFGSGRAVQRVEDPALLRGQGRFAADFRPPGCVVLRVVRSAHAHARLLGVDTAAARALPGVLAVWTAADLLAAGVAPLAGASGFRRADGQPMQPPPRHALAQEVLRHVGQPVAVVVAETDDAARAACDAVQVDAEPLPAVADARAALAPDAPEVWPGAPGNLLALARHGDAAAADAAFAAAAHVVALDLVNQRLAPSPLEPRSVLAWVEQDAPPAREQDAPAAQEQDAPPAQRGAAHGQAAEAATGHHAGGPASPGPRLLVRLSSQMPTAVRNGIAAALPGLRPEQVRVLVGDVGGGFGMKTGIYAEDLLVAFAAWTLRRPVQWTADRLEEFLAAVHGRDLVSHAELALDARGRALALRVQSLANVGAVPTGAGVAIQLLIGPWVSTSVYDIPVVDLTLGAVLTHTAATGAYRGAGRPEAIYVVERLMDAAARRLGLDAAELRRRNLVRAAQMPYRNAMGQTYDSGDFERILDQGLALADWGGFGQRRAGSAARGRLRGRGIATFLEWTGGNALAEQVQVRIAADGFVELVCATMPMGQGIATSYTQLAVDVLGLPPQRVRIVMGDTDRATGFGSAASRSLFTAGAALQAAIGVALEQARELAAQALEAPAADLEYAAGRFAVAGTDLGIGLFELAARQPGGAIAAAGGATASAASWPNGCHIAEVEVDPATGEVELVAYASVNDIGRIVSPPIVRGQVEGGAVQGIGQALCEQLVYDADGAQLLSASFMDYALPRVDGFRGFRTEFDQSVPCRTNALGAKGVGELGTIGATPAVVNAVLDALAAAPAGGDTRPLGARVESLQMPLTAERVWAALQGRPQPPLHWPPGWGPRRPAG